MDVVTSTSRARDFIHSILNRKNFLELFVALIAMKLVHGHGSVSLSVFHIKMKAMTRPILPKAL